MIKAIWSEWAVAIGEEEEAEVDTQKLTEDQVRIY